MGYCQTISNTLHGMKPALIMVGVQITFALVNIGYKLAANDGMNLSILVAYRFMFGAGFIVPIALIVERKKRPKLTWRVVLDGFLCGLFGGSLGQNLYLKSIVLTSLTFASAMLNLIPAFTFVVAICLRLERLGWNTLAGKAKVFGTLLGISGAMLLTFYKGRALNLWDTNINLLEITSSTHQTQIQNVKSGRDLVLGAILALGSCVCYSLWLIVQAKSSEKYPCPYSITAMMTLWASIQSVVFALCVERDWNQWVMGLDIRLLTVSVAGIFGSGLMFTLVAWCVGMRGPLFVSIFNPMLLVLVAIAGSLFMEEKIHLGILLGGTLIVMGLYSVLWGKSKELKKVSRLMPENQEEQVDIETPQPLSPRTGGSSRKEWNDEEEEEEDEEKRDSQVSSEVLGALYIYP